MGATPEWVFLSCTGVPPVEETWNQRLGYPPKRDLGPKAGVLPSKQRDLGPETEVPPIPGRDLGPEIRVPPRRDLGLETGYPFSVNGQTPVKTSPPVVLRTRGQKLKNISSFGQGQGYMKK